MYVKVYDGTYALGLKLKVLIYTCTCIMALQSSIITLTKNSDRKNVFIMFMIDVSGVLIILFFTIIN